MMPDQILRCLYCKIVKIDLKLHTISNYDVVNVTLQLDNDKVISLMLQNIINIHGNLNGKIIIYA